MMIDSLDGSGPWPTWKKRPRLLGAGRKLGSDMVKGAEANVLDRMCVGVLKNEPQERSLEAMMQQSVNEEQDGGAASVSATIDAVI